MITELPTLVNELFEIGNGHEEISENGFSVSLDVQKVDDSTIVLTIKRDTDKAEFEKMVNDLDDDIFQEVWDNLSDNYGLKELNEMYEGANAKNVISLFKDELKNVVTKRIESLNKYL